MSPSSLSVTACHRNLPSDSRRHISTPLSPLMSGFLGLPLFVPRKIFPPATTGFPFEEVPIGTFHLMFVPFLASQDSGRPFMAEAMLRCAVPPHIGQS